MLTGRRMVGSATSEPRALIYGAVAIELAVVLPCIGWFVLAPLLTIWVLGATWLAWRIQPIAPSAMVEEASPAMLVYLDSQENRAGKPNENYARELLELHTLGYTLAIPNVMSRKLCAVSRAGQGNTPQPLAICLSACTQRDSRHIH